MIKLKSRSELEILRENATILEKILEDLESMVSPGVRTRELDEVAESSIKDADGSPAFKGYRGFPSALCTSINEEIVHGIPSESELQSGDIVSLDLGIKRRGLFVDAATTVPVGDIHPDLQDLLSVTSTALTRGINKAQVGQRVSDISHAVGSFVKDRGYYVVKEFVGHGIGRDLHEDPQIPNYGRPGEGERLSEGMVFCIEPMVMQTEQPVEVLDDGWTAVTEDRKPSAHFEGMVAVTEEGPQSLVRGGG